MTEIIVHRRLFAQRLAGPKFATPAEAVAWLGAVQGQDFLPALWALGLRVAGATEGVIEQAVNDGHIVRTWPMRGTVHFVMPDDIRWLLALSAPRQLRMTPRHQQLGLDEATFAQSRRVIEAFLADGRPRIRPEVRQALDDAGISTEGQRGIHILARLSQEGLICLGPRQGKQYTFVLLDAWVPPGRELTRDEALAEMARCYFTGHGPATVRDFGWWAGLTAADARAGVAMAGAELAQEVIGGKTYWFAPTALPDAPPSPPAHLLPYLDEYLVAFSDRSAVLPLAYNARVDSGNMIFHQPIILAGGVAGIWTRQLKKERVDITATLLRPLTGAEREALADAAARYGAFLGLELALEVVDAAS